MLKFKRLVLATSVIIHFVSAQVYDPRYPFFEDLFAPLDEYDKEASTCESDAECVTMAYEECEEHQKMTLLDPTFKDKYKMPLDVC